MNLFLLAVIMRQVAILISLLLGYGIYKLWISEKIAKKYTNLAISVYMTLFFLLFRTTTLTHPTYGSVYGSAWLSPARYFLEGPFIVTSLPTI